MTGNKSSRTMMVTLAAIVIIAAAAIYWTMATPDTANQSQPSPHAIDQSG